MEGIGHNDIVVFIEILTNNRQFFSQNFELIHLLSPTVIFEKKKWLTLLHI